MRARKKQNNNQKLFISFLKELKAFLKKNKVIGLSNSDDDNIYVKFDREYDGIGRAFSFHTYGNDKKGVIYILEVTREALDPKTQNKTGMRQINTVEFKIFARNLAELLNKYKIADLYTSGSEDIMVVFNKNDDIYRYFRYRWINHKGKANLEYFEQTNYKKV